TDRLAVYQRPTDLVQLVNSGDGRPFAAVQSEDVPAPPALSGDLVGRTVVAARDYELTTNSTSFEVTAPGPGVIVLQESWLSDDFQVAVNGRPAKYLRVNHAFKGVAVYAPGTYRVSFTYRPRRFTLALWLCGVGTALTAGSWWWLRRSPPVSRLIPPDDRAGVDGQG